MIIQRLIDRLTGQTNSRRSERSSTRRGKNARRLRLESLQKRELMAGDLAQINGIAFIDADGDNTADVGEIRLQNVKVELFLDNGTTVGQQDAGDTFVGEFITGADGTYQFSGLDGNDVGDVPPNPPFATDTGLYVLQFTANTGGIQNGATSAVLTGVTLSDDVPVTVTDDTGVTAVTIDDFGIIQPSQPITETVVGQTTTSSSGALTSAGAVIGDERDVAISIVAATSGNSQFEVNAGTGQMVFSNGGDVEATLLLQYDGIDGDGAGLILNPTGLGGMDLTDGDSVAALLVRVRSDTAVTDGIEIRVYTSTTNFSTATVDVPDNFVAGTTQDFFIPFTDFVADAGGTGAVFTNVGAIEAFADGTGAPGWDLFVSVVESRKSNPFPTVAPATVPLILGGEVFLDNGGETTKVNQNNGIRDAGEGLFQAPALNAIQVNLYDTDPTVGSPAPIATTTVNPLGSGGTIGSYEFSTLTGGAPLGPGTYFVVIPASEFGTGQPLFGHIGSQIDTPAGITNDNADNDNDGVFVAGIGFVSGAITLSIGDEPAGGGNENTTVDFGVLPTTDLRIDKTLNGTSNVVTGGTAIFDVTIRNLGSTAATNVTVSDIIPTGLTFVSVQDSGGANVATTGTTTRTFSVPGTLAAGATVTYRINTTIDATLTADPTNEISVSGFQVETLADTVAADRVPGTTPVIGTPENNTAFELVDVPLATLTISKTDNIDSPATTTAGNQLTYTITVQNTSTDTATNVIALDTLPVGVTFVANSGTFTTGTGTVALVSGGADDGKVRIDFGNMPAGETEVVTFAVTVNPAFLDADSPLNNSITVGANNAPSVTDTDQTPVAREVDVTVAKTVVSTRTPDDRTDGTTADDIIDSTAPFNVFAGGFVTYQIVATNAGPSEARGVTVVDTLAAGLTLVPNSFNALTSGAILTPNGQTLNFTVPNLAPGESRTFTFEAAVGSDQFTAMTNSVVIATTDTEPTGHAVNTSSVQVTPTPRVDLILDKQVNVTTAVPGRDQIIYTFLVSHDVDSISDAINVDVTDVLPVGLTGVLIDAPGSTGTPSFNTTTRALLVEYASIPVGTTRTFTVTANINNDATANLVNTASVTVPGVTELDLNNNTDTVTVTLTPEFDVTLTKTVNGTGSVGPLDNVTFTIVVSHDTNDDGTETDNGLSPSLARGIVVTDVLPTGLTFLSATAGGAAVTPTSTTNGNIVFPTFDLAPGVIRTLTVTASVDDSAAAGVLTNNVSLVTAAGQTQTNNDSASAPVTIVPQADVRVTKTVSATRAQAGSQLTYTVNVFNDGPSPAAGVSVVDTLPAGVTFVSGTGPNGALSAVGQAVTVTPLSNAPLASGASFQFTIIASINAGVTADQVNNVVVSTTTAEPTGHAINTASVTTTIDQAINELSGVLFRDFNDDGIQNGMDSPLAGVEILLTGGGLDAAGRRTTTSATGAYSFTGLIAGDYQVRRLDMPQFFLDGKEQDGASATPADSGDTILVTLGGTSPSVIPQNNFALVPFLSYKLCIL